MEAKKIPKTETKLKWEKYSEKRNWNWKIVRNLNHAGMTVQQLPGFASFQVSMLHNAHRS